MPETVTDQYASQIRSFVLPPELTNKDQAPPAEPPAKPEEAKPATEAVVTPPEPEKEEPEKETTEKVPEKDASRRFERRIDRLHRRAAEAQARAEALERELNEVKARQPQPTASKTQPRMEDYTDVQEYAKAYAAYEKDQALREYQEKQRTEASKAEQSRLQSDWEARVAKAVAKYEDFEEVVGDLQPTTPWAVAIMEAENGTDIAHYLGSHPAEARKIMQLSPVGQIREIGKLELKLAAPPERPKQPSQAPKPIEPVKPEAKLSDNEIEPQMPFEKYKKIGDKMFRGR
jgi:hypothetical protein